MCAAGLRTSPPRRPFRRQVGELRVRGYSVMKGYWADQESTASAIDQVPARGLPLLFKGTRLAIGVKVIRHQGLLFGTSSDQLGVVPVQRAAVCSPAAKEGR